ncbi:MAG: MFS transporter [Candidatus Marinimicrobia bacterium]|jgi:MFS family permease|nr:MFS transporter [Candidatus Neomarinimicrobiota bacterium]|tara:strand:+ start:946 stop:2193 length:1248 start_codon:yes stop_codon:yes gene_type:complete
MSGLSLKDHYKNQKFNNLHEFFWGFGTAFHTVYAVVPLFLKELGAPNVIATSSAGLFSIIIAMPMLFTAALTRNVTNMKKMVISAHCTILIVTFILGYIFTFSGIGKSLIAWKIYFILFIIYSLSIGIIVPIWADFLEKTTKRSLRGKFFGVGFAFNSLGAFGGGILLKFLLETSIPFPKNFGYGFIILFFCLSIGTFFFAFYKEKKQNKSNTSFNQFKIETKQIIKNRPNFHRYLFSRIFYCATLPALGLYAVFCQKKFGFNISEIGLFTVLNVISMGISSYISGYLGDKHGHKISMLIAYSFHLIAVILALLSKNMFWVYCIFISIGAGQGAFMPSAMNLIYDFADLEDKKTYMALIDSFLAPFSLMFLVGIGFLITKNQFVLSFCIIGFCLLIALLILYFFVKDPKLKKISA